MDVRPENKPYNFHIFSCTKPFFVTGDSVVEISLTEIIKCDHKSKHIDHKYSLMKIWDRDYIFKTRNANNNQDYGFF
jgi:hypothetical protein